MFVDVFLLVVHPGFRPRQGMKQGMHHKHQTQPGETTKQTHQSPKQHASPTQPPLPGKPYPLGAQWDGLGINFAVFSANATRIELCLFDPTGRKELARLPLPECTDEVWHGYLPGVESGLVYGYRAFGPWAPHRGHRFNPHKLLLDPYARRLVGALRWSDALFGYRLNSNRADLSFDRRDSAPACPKGVVTDESFNWGNDVRPNTPWSRTVIYETHVRGASMLREDLLPPSAAPLRRWPTRSSSGICRSWA